MDESDQFLEDPFGFATKLAKNWTRPSRIVMFDSQEKLLKEFLASNHFYEVRLYIYNLRCISSFSSYLLAIHFVIDLDTK